jgi:hypothetical protein
VTAQLQQHTARHGSSKNTKGSTAPLGERQLRTASPRRDTPPLATWSDRPPPQVATLWWGQSQGHPPAPTPSRLTKHSRSSLKTTPRSARTKPGRPQQESQHHPARPPHSTRHRPRTPKTAQKTLVDNTTTKQASLRTTDSALAPATPKHTRGKAYPGNPHQQPHPRGKISRSVRDT